MTTDSINKSVITICISVLLIFSGLSIWHYSVYLKVQENWQVKSNEFKDLETEVAHIKKMIALYKEDEKKFAEFLFDERDIPSFLDEISSFARESYVNIIDMKTNRFVQVNIPKSKDGDSLSPTPQQEVDRIMTLSAMPIRINVNGTFSSLAEFFNRVQDYRQLVNVSNVKIETTDKYPRLKCSFTLRIYSLKKLEELKG